MVTFTRYFDGKKYTFRSSHRKRARADQVARNLRGRGAFARVITKPKTKYHGKIYVVFQRGRNVK